MLEIEDIKNIKSLKKTITTLLDFDCSLYSDSFLIRRISIRLRANNIGSYQEYDLLLKKNKEEREKLNKELTVHTTNFFRDASLWDALIKEAIPLLAELKKQNKSNKINIWSAGCSTGEEPVTIAICFYEALGLHLDDFHVKILGTDLDYKTIRQAQEAVYDKHQFREMPGEYKDKYFEKVDEDAIYVPKQEIR